MLHRRSCIGWRSPPRKNPSLRSIGCGSARQKLARAEPLPRAVLVPSFEIGDYRADRARLRARGLRDRLDEVLLAFERKDLDFEERHRLAHEIDLLWDAKHYPDVEPRTRLAMQLLEAVDVACTERVLVHTVRQLANKAMGKRNDTRDEYEKQLDSDLAKKATSTSKNEAKRIVADAKRKNAVGELASMQIIPRDRFLRASRLFAASHAHLAAQMESRHWQTAFDAWERGRGSRLRGSATKWDVLSNILKEIQLTDITAISLNRQWLAWKSSHR